MSKRSLWSIVLLLTLLIATGGYVHYRVDEQLIRKEALGRLDAITELKVEPIVELRRRLLGDVQASASGAAGNIVLAGEREGWDQESLEALRNRFKKRHHFFPHDNVILARPDGEVFFSMLGHPKKLDEQALRLVQACVSSGMALLGEVVHGDDIESGKIQLDAVAPIKDESDRIVAVLIHREDPDRLLLPLLRFWPVPTSSAATMLVRRDGDQARVLHSHEDSQGKSSLRLAALGGTETLLGKAALGMEGRFEGPDERGVEVLARLAPVPESTWTLAARVDRNELLAQVGLRARVTIILVVLGILLIGAGAQILFRLGRQRNLQRLLDTERAAREQDHKFQAMIEKAADVITVASPDGTMEFMSPSIRELAGYEPQELVGLNGLDFVHPDDIPSLVAALEDILKAPGNMVSGIGYRFRRKDGSYLHLESVSRNLMDDPAVRGIVINARDMTAVRQMEEQRTRFEASARQQQKLESIGTLASGVAHEINNPLNVILNYGQLLLDDPSDPDQVHDFAEQIVKEGERVAVIVRNLLAFSRQDREARSTAAISDIVANTLPLISTLMRNDRIDIRTEIPGDLPMISCRFQQIQQVLMNLLTNARDALNQRFPQGSVDKIVRISAAEVDLNGSRGIRLTFEDHGGGIPADVVPRIFDPFFTTKPRERGTGLGLSISYGIVREHDGNLWVESDPGNWTRFHVDLPVGT